MTAIRNIHFPRGPLKTILYYPSGKTKEGLEMPFHKPNPFRIAIPDETLLDLKHRLQQVRWPDAISDGWDYGTDLRYLRSFVDYWRDDYDWRKYEAELNELKQYTVPLDSIDLHYIHVEGKGPSPMPLLMTHGWPSSFADFRRAKSPPENRASSRAARRARCGPRSALWSPA